VSSRVTAIPDNYYLAFPKDRLYVKTLVSVLFVMETVQTILNTHDLYKMYAEGFANPEALDGLHLAWIPIPILTGLCKAIGTSLVNEAPY
jgi:hypothetical protein